MQNIILCLFFEKKEILKLKEKILTLEVPMKSPRKKEFTEENFLKNGTKTQNQWANNKLNTTVKEPGINESGIQAKKDGWE